MSDPGYYRDIINSILSEQTDDVPELPSDVELDKLKLQTQIQLGKAPKWLQYFERHDNIFDTTINGFDDIEYIYIVWQLDDDDEHSYEITVKYHDITAVDFNSGAIQECDDLLSERFGAVIDDCYLIDAYIGGDRAEIHSRALYEILKPWLTRDYVRNAL